MELEKSLNEYLEKIEKYLKPLIVSERVDIVKEIYPLAKDFTDFLRLLLSLKTTNAIQQVVWMDKDAFENFMNDPDEVRYICMVNRTPNI